MWMMIDVMKGDVMMCVVMMWMNENDESKVMLDLFYFVSYIA